MSGCGKANCNCGPSCTGCNCAESDSMMTSSFECDTDGCGCSSCSDCAPSCGCSSCSTNH